MLLPDLLKGLVETDVPALHVRGLALDSREVKPGTVFAALKGAQRDGCQYIDQAIAAGAVAILADAGCELEGCTVPLLPVANLRGKLGEIAARIYADPTEDMTVIGVTGTNGKTTLVWLLAQALNARGDAAAVIGTLGYGVPGKQRRTAHTTPDAVQLQGICREIADEGARYLCMEVSSHGIDQGRIGGIHFDIAVFTNLSRDHLDYHGDMETYASVKRRLFADPDLSFAVVNGDDDYAESMLSAIGEGVKVIRFGMRSGDVRVVSEAASRNGIDLEVATPVGTYRLQTSLVGRYNIYNLLAMVATLFALGWSLDQIEQVASELKPPPGRMEVFSAAKGGPVFVVDYAHTPDALKQVLLAIREHTPGKLWCIFGCGGNRDKGKRPLMGKVAEDYADFVIVTDDNPREEPAEMIVAEIISGMRQKPEVIRNRRQAITRALQGAREDDAVVVAGKGHEDYQIIGDQRLHYSDRETVAELLGMAA